ncbi:hypothetical protein, partial [Kordiimonas sp.]|uniref:hypothetical protein n=1 Tax=Kordiimonas sp. TaxID=1970157 RepID=UPI003A8DDA05
LGVPPAFVLSQDQTLKLNKKPNGFRKNHRSSHNQKIFLTMIAHRAQEFTDTTSLEVAGYIRGLQNLRSILEI